MSLGSPPRPSPPRPHTWLISGAVVTVVSLAGAVIATWFWLAGPQAVASVTVPGSQPVQSITQNQTYHHPISRIELNLSAGDLALSSGAPGEVTVQRKLRWTSSEPQVTQDWDGDTLRITAVCPNAQRDCTANYTVQIPAEVTVQAHTAAGAVTVRDVTGDLNLIDDAGRTELDNVTGALQVRSAAGDIIGHRLGSRHVKLSSSAGLVSVGFGSVPDSVTATSAAGQVRIMLPRTGTGIDGYQVQADTDAGRRIVSVAEDSAGRHSIVAHSDAGDVSVSYA